MTAGPPVRIALTISSGASLGAYEAGATAGLVVALQRLNERDARDGRPASVVLDAIGGTSAGAMVGLLAGRCLLAGLDPVAVLHEGWVRRASLRRLTRGRSDAPLTMAGIHEDTVALLEPRDRWGRRAHRVADATRQRRPVEFTVGLGNLQGLTSRIDGTAGGPVHSGLSHVDRADFTLRPDDDRDRYVCPERSSPLDAAIASMSHPALFDPRPLDRRPDEQGYRRAGVENFPGSGHFWYADGGTLVRHPLGATLDAARRSDRRAWAGEPGPGDGPAPHRVHVLVHPHTAPPGDDGRWTDPDRRPAWSDTFVRMVTTLPVESLYADLRGIEAVNARLHRLDEVAGALASRLDADAVRELRRTLREAGGVGSRVPVTTEVVSPLRLLQQPGGERPPAGQERVPDLLAGEFLLRFGGFGGRAFRHSDFVLGWQSLQAWLPDALARAGLPEAAVAAAVAAVDERDVRHRERGRRGQAALGDVPLRTRLRMAAVLAHGARSVLSDVLRGRSRDR
ncbi:patatin-like phospholipase family protein [Blastococcus sp. VKM Ac-2987]|uniref:patatin-like phospholipase family protein n=1 Tax=Blastococcus sp. VKM Ac-2987 TaxID=3004141 RepID=UPI0022AB9536|nr:patatin-like phospholipase family protein [Blastococcus sp. VKM Ac-2987]MCZ2857304.1 patatin-like phospholipase family protein [Blastococcus sp. VKM Ac-2987]